MVFTAKSSKINIEEVRALSKLEGQALERKSQRDQELEALYVEKTSEFSW